MESAIKDNAVSLKYTTPVSADLVQTWLSPPNLPLVEKSAHYCPQSIQSQ
jgi:hypothetical protein